MEDIMKIVKSVGESGLIIKGISEKLKMKQKNKKEDFFAILLGTFSLKKPHLFDEPQLHPQWL